MLYTIRSGCMQAQISSLGAQLMHLTGKLPLCHALFDQDAIVLKGTTGTVTLASERGNRGVRLIAPDFPIFGCWHMPKTDAPYVCLEPWSRSGVIEDLKTQPDLICLPAGEDYRTQWSLTCF